MNYFLPRLLALAGTMAIIQSGCGRFSQKEDYTFVVAGDDRLAPADTAGNPATTNTYHLKRMFNEIAQLKPLPKYLFFNGDLIMGYTDNDTVRLERELSNWIKLYKESPLESLGVKLVAIPGNHEVVEKLGSGKISFASDERTYERVMKDYIRGNNGPHITGFVPGTDSLMTDQSRLSYSFDYGGDHFVVLNTDPVARESRVPYHWLEKDLKEARKQGARHIFLFSHKPPFPSRFSNDDGLDTWPANRDSMWAIVEKYNCDAYFCSHLHLWDDIEPHPGKTWEIICGNAGAPMEKYWLPHYYGFTVVSVSSDVHITSMGHDADRNNYMAPTPDNKTIIRATLTIK